MKVSMRKVGTSKIQMFEMKNVLINNVPVLNVYIILNKF